MKYLIYIFLLTSCSKKDKDDSHVSLIADERIINTSKVNSGLTTDVYAASLSPDPKLALPAVKYAIKIRATSSLESIWLSSNNAEARILAISYLLENTLSDVSLLKDTLKNINNEYNHRLDEIDRAKTLITK